MIKEGSTIQGWKILKHISGEYYKCECLLCSGIFQLFLSNLSGNMYCCFDCKVNPRLEGKRIGKLLVIRVINKIKRIPQYECKCDCSARLYCDSKKLICGEIKSCHECIKGNATLDDLDFVPFENNINSRIRAEFSSRIAPLILERDNFECQVCKKEKDLNVHHIFGFAYYKELRLNIFNGITLCYDCHRDYHNNIKFSETNLETFEEFFQIKYKYREELLKEL